MRVLFAAHSPFRGGAEYCLDTTLRHLDRRRIDPVVLFPFEGPLVGETRALGIETHVMPMCHWLYFDKDLWFWRHLIGGTLANIGRMARLIESRHIDAVYTNTSAIFEPALAARRAGVPHVWHVHEVLTPGSSMQQLLPIRWIQRIISRLSDRVVFESNAARRAFEDSVPASHGVVVPNSVRLEPVVQAPDVDAARRGLDLRPGVPTVLFAGQFIDRKNPLLLVEAIRQVPRTTPVQCVFAGAGPLEAAIRRRIADASLEDRCRVIPFQAEIAPVIAASDILVLPSRQESFGLVLVEAAALGKPAIACMCEGPSEIIVEGQTGVLVPQDDSRELASAIVRLVTSPETTQRMGEAARRRAETLFSADANTRILESVMLSVARTPSAAPVREAGRA